MLSKQLQDQIEQEAKAEAKQLTDRIPSYRFGYEAGWYNAGEKYAALYETALARAERAEKALEAILNTSHDNYEKVIMKVKQIATQALTPKTNEDELCKEP